MYLNLLSKVFALCSKRQIPLYSSTMIWAFPESTKINLQEIWFLLALNMTHKLYIKSLNFCENNIRWKQRFLHYINPLIIRTACPPHGSDNRGATVLHKITSVWYLNIYRTDSYNSVSVTTQSHTNNFSLGVHFTCKLASSWITCVK